MCFHMLIAMLLSPIASAPESPAPASNGPLPTTSNDHSSDYRWFDLDTSPSPTTPCHHQPAFVFQTPQTPMSVNHVRIPRAGPHSQNCIHQCAGLARNKKKILLLTYGLSLRRMVLSAQVYSASKLVYL